MQSIELITAAWEADAPLTLEFPDAWQIEVLGDQPLPALALEAIRARVQEPLAGPPLASLASGRERAALIVDDLTRPTPAAPLIAILLEALQQAGLPPERVTIVIAGGTHEPLAQADIHKKVGFLPEGVRVVAHDSHHGTTCLGVSAAGTPLHVNQAVLECDLKIGVGCIYPHPAAGFSGGAKVLVPGAAGFETVRYLHDNFQGAGQRGGPLDNPFRQEVERIAEKIGLDFIVNAAINQRREICGIFAGDMRLAFQQGVAFARQAYTVPLRPGAAVVIADMYPFDADLQFAYDRGLWPVEQAGQGAARLVLASCPKGLGSHELYPAEKSFQTRLVRRLKYFRLNDLWTLAEKVGAARRMLSRRALPVDFVSPGLGEAQVKNLFPSGRLFPDWPAARAGLENERPGAPLNVAVYRCAPLMLPIES